MSDDNAAAHDHLDDAADTVRDRAANVVPDGQQKPVGDAIDHGTDAAHHALDAAQTAAAATAEKTAAVTEQVKGRYQANPRLFQILAGALAAVLLVVVLRGRRRKH